MTGTLPGRALAAVLTDFGQPLELRELAIPAPAPGALIVDVIATSVCATDVHLWEGALRGVLPGGGLPMILGHETIGRIVAFGPGPRTDSFGSPLAEGDRIAWTHEFCERCDVCNRVGLPMLCPNRRAAMFAGTDAFPHLTGGFATHQYVWENAKRIRVPDDLDDTWAAAATCAGRTVTVAFGTAGRIRSGETVVIQGSGPLGLFATAMAAVAGPAQLIVIGDAGPRLEVAREWGATATISLADVSTPEGRIAAVRELTGGRGADVLFELSGRAATFAEGVEMAGRGARYVIAGIVDGEAAQIRPGRITNGRLRVSGVFSSEIGECHEVFEFMRRFRGRFGWDRMISGRYSLDQATQALTAMRQHSEIKPVVIPGAAR